MTPPTPTIGDIIASTAERGMSDLLIAVADYFYCIGAGSIPPPAAPGRADLLATLECIHRIEILGPRQAEGPTPLADDIPGWLLSLGSQADVIEPPPVEGWPV